MTNKNNKYNVIVSKKAAQMMVNHAAFLAKVSISAAEILVNDFEKAVSSLEDFPRRCPWLTVEYLPKHQYRSLFFGKGYLIIYQIIDSTVYVDYVVDCREDYTWLMK